MSDMHVWTADSQTKQARMEWVETLDRMLELKPKQVIPGHYGHEIPQGTQAISFTKEYLVKFEQALDSSTHSSQVIEKMRAQYPVLPDDGSLQLSAEVNMAKKLVSPRDLDITSILTNDKAPHLSASLYGGRQRWWGQRLALGYLLSDLLANRFSQLVTG